MKEKLQEIQFLFKSLGFAFWNLIKFNNKNAYGCLIIRICDIKVLNEKKSLCFFVKIYVVK